MNRDEREREPGASRGESLEACLDGGLPSHLQYSMDAVLRPNDHNTMYTYQHDFAGSPSPTKTAQPRTRGSPGLHGSPGFNLVSDASAEQHMGGGSTSASPLRGANNPGAGRRAFLTPERIATRHGTLIDAFNTADRKQRGHLPYNRVLEIYALYFHSSVGQLQDEELAAFVEKFSHHAGDGSIVVAYPALADALKKRDVEMMAKAEARALRATVGGGAGALSFSTPERAVGGGGRGGGGGGGRGLYTPTVVQGGVAAALRMVDDSPSAPQGRSPTGLAGRPRPPPLSQAGPHDPSLDHSPGGGATRAAVGRRERGLQGMDSAYAYAHAANQSSPYALEGGRGVGEAHANASASQFGAMGAAAASSLQALLDACEAADEDRSGKLHAASLLTCCRMQGVPESSAMLRAVIAGTQAEDGRVDYVSFVQQIAAQRAGGAARASVAQYSQQQMQMQMQMQQQQA